MGTGKQYDEDFKKQAIKLAREVGNTAAAEELGIPKGTLGTWMHKARLGEIDTGSGTRDPEESLNLAQQLQAANKRFYCRAMEVTRTAFYDYIDRKNQPWKYQPLADEMIKIHNEDKCNDCYGRERMYMALTQKKESGEIDIDIPCEKHASQMTY